MGVVDDLAQAREAYERRDWMAAYNALSAADPSALDGEDFVRLAMTADLLGRHNDCVQALQRAFRVHHDAGDVLGAVRSASWLALTLVLAGESSVAGGWVRRGERLLTDVPDDVVEHGHLGCARLLGHILAGEFEAAWTVAEEVVDYGVRYGADDLTAFGLCAQGRLAMYSGRVADGLRLMDESMVVVASGELSPVVVGHVYCTLIEGCQEVSDYGRVAEWTAALHAWCQSQPDLVLFTGQCAVHRGQIMRVQGAWPAAIEEFDRAVERYLRTEVPQAAGLALAERGDVQRLTGDLDAAEASYARAGEYGFEPQPGLALLWHARGRTSAALAAVRRLLAEPRDPVHRAQLLPGAVEVLLAADQRDEAGPLVDELAGFASEVGCAALRAMAEYAHATCCWRGARERWRFPHCARRSRCGEVWAPATRSPGPGRWWGSRAGCWETRSRPGSSSRPPATSVARWAPGRSRRSCPSCWSRRPPGGSRPARRRCCAWWRRGGATPRSRPHWCSARRPWPVT